MALQRIPGRGVLTPVPAAGTNFSSSALFDATGEKAAMLGRVVWYGSAHTGTKNISRIGLRFGTVTKAGGSGLTLSLQDVDLSNGPPGQPDGTQDQTVAIANGNASFASNTYIRTGTLSATRTVSWGDRLAIVLEFDGSGRLGADTVSIATAASTLISNVSVTSILASGVWTLVATDPNVVIEFDDGTFGTLENASVVKAINSLSYNSGSAADEVALPFSLPFPCSIDALWAQLTIPSGADCDLVLYDGTTALASVSIDSNTVGSASNRLVVEALPSEQTLLANHTYYVAVKPTTTNNVTITSYDVDDANIWAAADGGTSFAYTTRVDAGAWAAVTTTRRLAAGFRMSRFDDGVSVGGGGIFSSVIKAA